jgi:hypothetical protein
MRNRPPSDCHAWPACTTSSGGVARRSTQVRWSPRGRVNGNCTDRTQRHAWRLPPAGSVQRLWPRGRARASGGLARGSGRRLAREFRRSCGRQSQTTVCVSSQRVAAR